MYQIVICSSTLHVVGEHKHGNQKYKEKNLVYSAITESYHSNPKDPHVLKFGPVTVVASHWLA